MNQLRKEFEQKGFDTAAYQQCLHRTPAEYLRRRLRCVQAYAQGQAVASLASTWHVSQQTVRAYVPPVPGRGAGRALPAYAACPRQPTHARAAAGLQTGAAPLRPVPGGPERAPVDGQRDAAVSAQHVRRGVQGGRLRPARTPGPEPSGGARRLRQRPPERPAGGPGRREGHAAGGRRADGRRVLRRVFYQRKGQPLLRMGREEHATPTGDQRKKEPAPTGS